MWTTAPPLRLLRYLIVLRVNRTAARLAPFPAANFSATLGEIIASRLSTQEARAWHRALQPWAGYAGEEEEGRDAPPGQSSRPLPQTSPPEAAWPIDAILHVYPGKQIYGYGEQILWEIKLLGDSANHNLFLELLLPAIESAGLSADPRWVGGNSLWGRYEIDRVSVARGLVWQPLAQQGRIDLSLRPDPLQWADGLPFRLEGNRYVRKVTWQTPFAPDSDSHQQKESSLSAPGLATLLEACARQIEAYLPGWLASGQRPAWEQVVATAQKTPVVHSSLTPPPNQWPGQLIGEQIFSRIPASALPYLVFGSLLHIGRYRHFGCGTFLMQPSR